MTQTSSIAPEDVVAALGRGSLFPAGSEQFELFAPYIGHLVEIIGEDYMDDPVSLGSLSETTARFMTWLFSNQDFLNKPGATECNLYQNHEEVIQALELTAFMPEIVMALAGETEASMLLSDAVGLSEAAKELYRNGELTFGALLTDCPEVFVS